ncbi:1-phosphatidylinositol 45-bisphosphate phosphodiesterase beta-3, partial [Dissostichus eleginoides]
LYDEDVSDPSADPTPPPRDASTTRVTSSPRARHEMCRSAVTRKASLECDGQRDDCFPAVEFFRRCSEDHTEMARLHRPTDD